MWSVVHASVHSLNIKCPHSHRCTCRTQDIFYVSRVHQCLRIHTVWSESSLVTQGNFMILSYTLSAQKTPTILRWCRNHHVSALFSVKAFPTVSRVHQQGLRSACASCSLMRDFTECSVGKLSREFKNTSLEKSWSQNWKVGVRPKILSFSLHMKLHLVLQSILTGKWNATPEFVR